MSVLERAAAVVQSGAAQRKGRRHKSGSSRKKVWKLFAGTIALCTAFVFGETHSRATEEYAYTVTFYPGNHGTFQGTGELRVNEKNNLDELVPVQNDGSYQIEQTDEYIRVSGLKAGQYVVFGDVDGAVKPETGSRYYVKGIRVSGRDNDTVDIPAFPVEGDRDYVVAYGIQGDLTSYVVNYQDADGNVLAPSRTYFGNVGDKPVIAFRYIEGYQPQAYNLTKTLSKNTAENVFTFTYRRTPVPSGGGNEGGGAGDTGNDGAEAGAAGTAATGNEAGAGTTGTGAAGTAAPGTTVVTPGGQTGADQTQGGEQGDDAQTPDNTPGSEDQSQEEIPEPDGPQDVYDLDDEDLPLAGVEKGAEEAFRFPMWASVCIAAAGMAVVGIVLWIMMIRRKKEKAQGEG